jgi:hypothetical protein
VTRPPSPKLSPYEKSIRRARRRDKLESYKNLNHFEQNLAFFMLMKFFWSLEKRKILFFWLLVYFT